MLPANADHSALTLHALRLALLSGTTTQRASGTSANRIESTRETLSGPIETP